jgi:hypothetical protein
MLEQRTSRWVETATPRLSMADQHLLRDLLGVRFPRGSDAAWMAKLQEAIDFVDEHGRVPGQATGTAEYALGAWANSQRVNRNGLSHVRRQAILDRCPQLFETASDRWMRNLHEYAEFYERKGRRPSSTLSQSAEELRLGRWGQTQRNVNKALSDFERKEIELICPDILDRSDWDTVWETRLREVHAFFTSSGRWPRKDGGLTPEKERVLGHWRGNQRKRRGELTLDQLELAERLCPGIFALSDPDSVWLSKLQVAAGIASRTGKPPRKAAKGRSDEEIMASQWWGQQRNLFLNGKMRLDRIEEARRLCPLLVEARG